MKKVFTMGAMNWVEVRYGFDDETGQLFLKVSLSYPAGHAEKSRSILFHGMDSKKELQIALKIMAGPSDNEDKMQGFSIGINRGWIVPTMEGSEIDGSTEYDELAKFLGPYAGVELWEPLKTIGYHELLSE